MMADDHTNFREGSPSRTSEGMGLRLTPMGATAVPAAIPKEKEPMIFNQNPKINGPFNIR
jgi:hypothetical protein